MGILLLAALAGGVGAGERGGVVLLTPRTSLAPQAETILSDHGDVVATCEILGGTGAVDSSVDSAIHNALGW